MFFQKISLLFVLVAFTTGAPAAEPAAAAVRVAQPRAAVAVAPQPAVSAAIALPAAPVLTRPGVFISAKLADSEYDPNPQYTFAYNVQDDLTGDSKSQVESRSGDVVQGQYSFIEADGVRRTVDYTADPVNGFNAIVNRGPLIQAVSVDPNVAEAVRSAAPVVIARQSKVAKLAAVAPAASRYVAAQPQAAQVVVNSGPVTPVQARFVQAVQVQPTARFYQTAVPAGLVSAQQVAYAAPLQFQNAAVQYSSYINYPTAQAVLAVAQ